MGHGFSISPVMAAADAGLMAVNGSAACAGNGIAVGIITWLITAGTTVRRHEQRVIIMAPKTGEINVSRLNPHPSSAR